MIQRFGRAYAAALLKVARSTEAGVQLRDELRAFAAVLEAEPRIAAMAANPAVPKDVKERVVEQLAQRVGAGDLARKFLGLLLANFRLGSLPAVLEALDRTLNRRLGIAVADIQTATPLGDGERAQLAATLERMLGRKVQLAVEVDPSLIAGFVARVDSSLYDASLRGQLQRLATRLAQA